MPRRRACPDPVQRQPAVDPCAQGPAPPTAHSESWELLTELMQARAAVRQYGTKLNQIAAAMNSGVSEPPVWLAAGGRRRRAGDSQD